MELNKFVAMLDANQRGNNRYLARCPAHDDKKPSLSITERDNRILLKCWAGCTAQEVVAAMGLKMQDLFNDGRYPVTAKKRGTHRKNLNRLWKALMYELHVLYLVVSRRVDDRELAHDRKYCELHPEFRPMPDEPWEREIEAVKVIKRLLGEIYE